MKRPTLSVGMPNFNHARFLPAALGALLGQSYRPLEIIVIDDASTDDSVEVIGAFARKYPHLKLIRHERNRGINTTLSELLEMASGDYFLAPAADDMIFPGFLEKSMRLLEKHPLAGLCSAQMDIIDEGGRFERRLGDNPIRGRRAGYYMPPRQCATIIGKRGLWVHGNTAVFRREALIEAGGYQEELGYYHDGYMHQFLAMKHGACFIPEPLAAERQMSGTFSNRSKTNPLEMRRIRNAALARMRGEHRQVFTEKFVRRWTARWDYWRSAALMNARLEEWIIGIRQILDCPDFGGWLLRKISFLAFSGVKFTVKAAAVVILAPFDVPRMIRRTVLSGIARPFEWLARF